MSEEEKRPIPMVNFTIDGKSVSVPKGTTVYNAARQQGIAIPIFCYQDRMPPLGACRVCLVAVEKMAKLQASCTLEATEGMVVWTQAATAVEGRKQILEFLLINHPLDCPICDKGGECPLQEQVLDHGGGKSRFFEDKRYFEKAKRLGPLLILDRERCVACARCTRFGDLIAGDHALELLDRGYKMEVGTLDGEPVKSKFIGNTISICPVGALTSQAYRFSARPWDLTSTDSTCTLCPIGCSLTFDARDGEIQRTRVCENRDVNDIWLCDKGWFGYTFSSHQDRLENPLIRSDGILKLATWDDALSAVAEAIKLHTPSGKLAGWGGNTLTFEESYLFQQLMRRGAGVNHVDHRIGMPLFSADEEGIAPGMEISLGQSEQLRYALILGCDLTEEFPLLWLRLKQAINRGAQVLYAGHFAPEIARYLHTTHIHAPGLEAEALSQLLPDLISFTKGEGRGAIFIGSQYLSSPYRKDLLGELSTLCDKTPSLSLNLLEGRGNSMGARLAGMHPEYAPLGGRLEAPGLNPIEVMKSAANDGWDFLYVVGANPVLKYPKALWKVARRQIKCLVVQELFMTETASEADIVLPVLSSVEKKGHFINIDGRIQPIAPAKKAPDGLISDFEIFSLLAKKLNVPLDTDLGVLLKSQKLERPPRRLQGAKPPISNPLQSGELRLSFVRSLFDDGQRMQRNPPLSQMTKEPRVRLHPDTAIQHGLSHDKEAILSTDGSILRVHIDFDQTVAPNTVLLPLGFMKLPTQQFTERLFSGLSVQILPVVD